MSKVNFRDTRLSTSTTGDATVDDGGSVESFPDTSSAQARFNYNDALARGSSLFAEYDYLQGTVLLRLSHMLTPDQAAAYKQALPTAVSG